MNTLDKKRQQRAETQGRACVITIARHVRDAVAVVGCRRCIGTIEQRAGILVAVVGFFPNVIHGFRAWHGREVGGFAAVHLPAHCVGRILVPCAVGAGEPVGLVTIFNAYSAGAGIL